MTENLKLIADAITSFNNELSKQPKNSQYYHLDTPIMITDKDDREIISSVFKNSGWSNVECFKMLETEDGKNIQIGTRLCLFKNISYSGIITPKEMEDDNGKNNSLEYVVCKHSICSKIKNAKNHKEVVAAYNIVANSKYGI